MAHRMCAARRSEPSRDRERLFALEGTGRDRAVPAAAGCALEVPAAAADPSRCRDID